jgi:oligoribonuclease NrnB/cAMP/cGMP phosphodiesterase (DHH superfamily)
MWRLKDLCRLTWIDHHKTSIDWAKEAVFYVEGLRATDLAACELTWMYFAAPNVAMPEAVKLLGRYDVWDHKDDRVLPFQYGMKCLAEPPDNMKWWDMLLQDRAPVSVGNVISVGRFCQEYQEKQDVYTCKSSGFDLEWEGLRWTVINGPSRGSSVHKSRFDPFAHDAMLGFWWNGKQWIFSLTTSKDIDLSAIAKKYGGGGHKQAAGFEAAELPFSFGKKD